MNGGSSLLPLSPAYWRPPVVSLEVASPKPQPERYFSFLSSLHIKKINFKVNGNLMSKFPGTASTRYQRSWKTSRCSDSFQMPPTFRVTVEEGMAATWEFLFSRRLEVGLNTHFLKKCSQVFLMIGQVLDPLI